MPYRRLPKTDAGRLKALKTVIDNNDLYTVKNRVVNWKTLNDARTAYEKLLTATEQYRISLAAQLRTSGKMGKLQHNATMYVSHFVQVLFMSVERGEIKRSCLPLYGLSESATAMPNIKVINGLLAVGERIIEGEKKRINQGGRPIYNPSIGMVSTHLDIFRDYYEQQSKLQERTSRAQEYIKNMREGIDVTLLDLWNQIEDHFKNEPPEVRFAECRKLGIVYYYRRKEPHLY